VDIGFGKAGVSAGRPRTTIRIDAATFEGVRAGTIAPMQTLLDGRLKIEGDRALAMQLLLLAGSRLGRR
jgi:putative sterol carrier protein